MSKKPLEERRAAAVAKEEAKAGIHDGATYRVQDGDRLRWYRVDIVFYPKTKWMVEELTGLANPEVIPNTRRPLDATLKARFESWL